MLYISIHCNTVTLIKRGRIQTLSFTPEKLPLLEIQSLTQFPAVRMELKHVPFSRAPLKLQLASNLFRPLLFRLKRALLEVDERKVEVREKL